VIAAKAEAFDPVSRYATDVFTGARPLEEDRMMMALYLERAKRVANIKSASELITLFPEVVRTLKYLGESPLAAAEKVVALHKRHGGEVKWVLEEMLKRYSAKIVDRSIPKDCLLRIVYDSGPAESRPEPPKKFHKVQEKRMVERKDSSETYRLHRSLGGWMLVFKGEQELLPDERGVALIDHLLKNPPDEPIHAVALEAQLDGTPLAVGGAVGGDGGGAIDAGNIGVLVEASGKKLMGGIGVLLKRELAELRSTVADDSLPESERDAAQAKISRLLSAQGAGGKMLGQAGLATDRVRKAMKKTITDCNKAELRRGVANTVLRNFGKHLEDHLWLPSMGVKGRAGAAGKAGCFTYERPPGITWRD
jgi:hypothetical protein